MKINFAVVYFHAKFKVRTDEAEGMMKILIGKLVIEAN